jgi:Phosphotransferase enzyme family
MPDGREGRSPLERMPHGYTNLTTRDGSVVSKSYQGPDAVGRCAREAAVLRALSGRLPVPPVIDCGGGTLSMGFMTGVHGQDLIDRGLAERVLRACGLMLSRIHAVSPALLAEASRRPRPGDVLVHGDYGPNNALLDAQAHQVTAVLDWEWAHAGAPAEDLAWCEWIVRMHHPEHVAALGSFFDSYGVRPSWGVRQQAMVTRCRALLDLCERWQPGGAGPREWLRRLAITESWNE